MVSKRFIHVNWVLLRKIVQARALIFYISDAFMSSILLLESEIFVFKASNVIYSTFWRQTHQHAGSPDPFIRSLLALYHKPTTFSKWETEMQRHNSTAPKWACAFANLPPASQPLAVPSSLKGTTNLFISKRPAVVSPYSHPHHLPTHSCHLFLHFITLQQQDLS